MGNRIFNGESRFMNFAAATADYIGTGALYVPIFEKEIMDNTRKRGTLLQRVKSKAANGHPTRYFEKTPHDNKTAFINPRTIDHALDTKVDRVERSAYIKACVDGITFGLFDKAVTDQQGIYSGLQGEDLNEMITDMLDAQDQAVWKGGAKDLMDSTSTEYCNILTQIKKTATVAKDARLTKAIMEAVAALMYNKKYTVHPTAIYMNPTDKQLLLSQEMDQKDKMKIYDLQVLPGIVISGIMTAAGVLPLIEDIYCPVGKIVITDESLLERQYVKSAAPQMYQLGTEKDLAQRYIAVAFDTFIVRGGNYGHMVVTIDGRTEETAIAAGTEVITINGTEDSPSTNVKAETPKP